MVSFFDHQGERSGAETEDSRSKAEMIHGEFRKKHPLEKEISRRMFCLFFQEPVDGSQNQVQIVIIQPFETVNRPVRRRSLPGPA